MTNVTGNRGAVATVRIAPVERWCESAKRAQNDIENVAEIVCGQPITILIQLVGVDDECGGKRWYVEADSNKRLTEATGGIYGLEQLYVCEHMLEMD